MDLISRGGKLRVLLMGWGMGNSSQALETVGFYPPKPWPDCRAASALSGSPGEVQGRGCGLPLIAHSGPTLAGADRGCAISGLVEVT